MSSEMTHTRLVAVNDYRDTGIRQMMLRVMLATAPGLVVSTLFFGWGTLVNVLLAALFCLLAEAICLRLRRRAMRSSLLDGSAAVSGILLGLCLPPLLPVWLTLLAASFAIVFGKQLYGGLGRNPFNPAMLGYIVLLIAFPADMSLWVTPAGGERLTLVQTLQSIFTGTPPADGITGATPLESFRHRGALTALEWQRNSGLYGHLFTLTNGNGWQQINLAFLVGGLMMLRWRLFTWHAPLSMLLALAIMALIFQDGGSSQGHGSVLFHLFSGGTMLGAFFILTEPVSGATTPRGRMVFGAGVGVLVFVIRAFGGYPDAVAFAVLLMNLAAPTIDHYTLQSRRHAAP